MDVVFSHRQAWARQSPELFFDTLRRLGDEGWEVVSAMPLAVAEKAGGFSVEPDRWLLFKRPLPEPQTGHETKGEDVLKGIVGRQLLKGRLPLP
ncbi:MAG TPA: hypothetical protein VFX49_15395 [Chloroflexota bacterium]|nr:hypothetical protein [Chloroflexota bacterium]